MKNAPHRDSDSDVKTPRPSRLTAWALPLCLFAFTVALYWPAHRFAFLNYDDDLFVSNNPHVTNGLSLGNVAWAFTTGQDANWIPLTRLSHVLDATLFGMNAGAHHMVNVLLHAINAVLLYVLWRKMTGCARRSFLVAALFAWHPLHVESVAWVSERKDVLSTLFWILTMIAYGAHVRAPGTMKYLLVMLCFTLGLLAKPMLVTLPFVLLLIDVWPLGRLKDVRLGDVVELCLEKVPLFVLSAGVCVTAYLTQRSAGAVRSGELYPLTIRLGNAAVAYVSYLLKTVWPAHLVVLYPHPGAALPWGKVAAAVVVLGVASEAVAWWARRRPWLAVGWLWYLGTLLPVIGVIQIGVQAMADRYTYVPLIGIFVMAAWSLPIPRPEARLRRALYAGVVAVLLIAFWGAARHQLGYWKDSATLFTRAVRYTSDNFVAQNALGQAAEERGDFVEAQQRYQEAMRIAPNYYLPRYNLAGVLAKQGNLEGAIEQYSLALQRHPGHLRSQYNLANLFLRSNRPAEAERHFRVAVQLDPSYTDAWMNLGIALAEQGRWDEGLEALTRAVAVDPEAANAQFNLGAALFARKEYAKAQEHLSRAVQCAPNDAAAHYALGQTLELLGDRSGASAEYAATLRVDPAHAGAKTALEGLSAGASRP